jgi:hypothetical protein
MWWSQINDGEKAWSSINHSYFLLHLLFLYVFSACLILRHMCPVLLVYKHLSFAHITKHASPLDNFLCLFSHLACFLVNCWNDLKNTLETIA